MNPSVQDLCSLVCYLEPAAVSPGMIVRGNEFYGKRLTHATRDLESVQSLFRIAEAQNVAQASTAGLRFNPEPLRKHYEGLSGEARLAWANAAFRLLERMFEEFKHDPKNLERLAPHLMALSSAAPEAGLPPYPLSTLLYRAGLALHEAARYESALPVLVRAVKATTASGDSNHPVVATRINTLGLCYQECGDLPNARRCFERALTICERVFGPTEEAVYRVDDERLLTLPLRNLCRVLLKQDDLEAVQRTYDRALNVYVAVHGPEHPLVAECANDMGQVWHEMGHLDRAEVHFDRAVSIEENARQPIPGNLAAYLGNLGTVLLAKGQVADAEHLFRRALTLDERDFGPRSAEYARDLAALGESLRKQKRLGEAIEALGVASKIYENSDAEFAPAQLCLLSSTMGKVAHAARDFPAAVEHFRRALGLARSTDPNNEFAHAREYAHLARSLVFDGQVELAIATAEKGLLVLTVSTDPRAPELRGTLLSLLGECLEANDDYAAAREQYDKALESDRAHLGETHPNVGRDLSRIGSLLAKQDDTVGALAHLNRALAILQETFGEDHNRVKRVRSKITRISNA